MTETKSERWVCCGAEWTDCDDHEGVTYRHCPRCGKPRPAPDPEMTEDERMALELRRAFLKLSTVDFGPPANGNREDWLNVLARARKLLCPAAEENGRREAYDAVAKYTLGEVELAGVHRWACQQRDACGPAKAAEAPAVDELRAEVERLKAAKLGAVKAADEQQRAAKHWEREWHAADEERDDLRAKLADAEAFTEILRVEFENELRAVKERPRNSMHGAMLILREQKSEIARLTRELLSLRTRRIGGRGSQATGRGKGDGRQAHRAPRGLRATADERGDGRCAGHRGRNRR